MMNINENKELKGTASITEIKPQTTPLKDGINFKDEFDRLQETIGLETLAQGMIPPLQIMPIQPDFSSTQDVETYDFSTKAIENNDAMFFLNISSQGESLNIKMGDELSIIDAANYKTMEVSKTLGDIMLKAQENNKAVRLDFDKEVTVVLRVSREGKIDATFFPQDKQVENYLKNNIDYLKVRFDEQSIAYSNISYKPYKDRQNNNNNNNKQGEKQ